MTPEEAIAEAAARTMRDLGVPEDRIALHQPWQILNDVMGRRVLWCGGCRWEACWYDSKAITPKNPRVVKALEAHAKGCT